RIFNFLLHATGNNLTAGQVRRSNGRGIGQGDVSKLKIVCKDAVEANDLVNLLHLKFYLKEEVDYKESETYGANKVVAKEGYQRYLTELEKLQGIKDKMLVHYTNTDNPLDISQLDYLKEFQAQNVTNIKTTIYQVAGVRQNVNSLVGFLMGEVLAANANGFYVSDRGSQNITDLIATDLDFDTQNDTSANAPNGVTKKLFPTANGEYQGFKIVDGTEVKQSANNGDVDATHILGNYYDRSTKGLTKTNWNRAG
ncbi:9078_t:CDS:2, partial [Ambispora leptoticha]